MRPDRSSVAPEPLLSKGELARYLGRSERWVDQLIAEGLPCLRDGRAERFERVAVLEWIDASGSVRARQDQHTRAPEDATSREDGDES